MSSLSGSETLPSVEAMVIDFPDFDSPRRFDKSTTIVRVSPSTFKSRFFIVVPHYYVCLIAYMVFHHT